MLIAVVVDDLQDALGATDVRCQWDNMGLDWIAYPRACSQAAPARSGTAKWEAEMALTRRQVELSDAIEDQQVMGPTPAELEALRETIRTSIASGPDALREALLQDLVAEVRVQSRRAIVPVFRLPLRGSLEPKGAVRELFRLVDPMNTIRTALPSSRARPSILFIALIRCCEHPPRIVGLVADVVLSPTCTRPSGVERALHAWIGPR